MSWQVGGKEPAENVLVLAFVIQQHSSVLAHGHIESISLWPCLSTQLVTEKDPEGG